MGIRLRVSWMDRVPSLTSATGEEDVWTQAKGAEILGPDSLDRCAVLWDQLLTRGPRVLAMRLEDTQGFAWEVWHEYADGYESENRRRAGFPPLQSNGSRGRPRSNLRGP